MNFANGIELSDTRDGLLVRQFEKAYIAKRWQLTPSTIELVETALNADMTWMIREGHPQAHSLYPNGQGRVYLAFSPTREKQWSVAIDTFKSNRGDYGSAVFNGKYHEQFLERGLPFKFEKRNTGSGHMVVAREHVLSTLKLLKYFDHDVLYIGRTQIDHSGFATEYDIQRSILQNWNKTRFGNDYVVVTDEYPVDGGIGSRRIDILARQRTKGDWLVIELKRAAAKMEALDQLEDYLLSLGRQDKFAMGKLRGALIAERVPAKVRTAAKYTGIAAFEISYPIEMKRVA